ncbi:NCS1 nucleoside transporter [Pyrrhoderma noxium]|uniref:NCS1 nucleoside transporter n=1 Tax=Pyrrhoderma noxium TaxID=2282107 RepID=A0A286UJ68_9AGAM|nr:NCS1 nucleoside transporter [Pyrrhoderma noxium]
MSSLIQRLRIQKQTATFTASSDDQGRGQVIECEPDLVPVPPLGQPGSELRRWHWFHLMGYWIAEAFGVSQYQVASSAVKSGLAPGTTIAAVFLGHLIISIPNALNGWIGATYGINFPVFSRASFGTRGVYLAILCRAIAAIFWFGTQTYQGGQCLQVMLQAIWPSFKNFPNHLPESASVTSSMLLCFFIFYLIQLPLLWIHMSKLRYLFLVKVIIMPIFGFTLFGWAVGRAHGFGPIFEKGTSITDGRPAAVVFFSAMTSAIAPKATLALNIADFTRYAKSPRTVVWTNLFSLSILVTLCAILGVVVTSAAEVIYGVSTWSPLQVSSLMENRAAQFFSALCWAISVIATNISANSTAVANDLMLVFPEYINIRRGQYVCAILGLITIPWKIQNSATTFTNFLGGYSIFLGPVAGCLIGHYWIVSNRFLDVPGLYRWGSGTTPYWYTAGWNWRAITAFTFGIVPCLPGFIRTVGGHTNISVGTTYVYSLVWPVSFTVALVTYTLLSKLFPHNYVHSAQSSSTEDNASVDKSLSEKGDFQVAVQTA